MATAHAQEGGAGGLSGGASAFSSGKYEAAVRQLTAALGSDKISASDAAKALYYRGLSYQRLGQSPRAVADLGSAIWLGLSPSERLSAMVNRSLAYRAAGLKTEADAELASARKSDKNGDVDRLLADNGGSAADAAAIAAFSTEVRPAGSSAPGTPANAEAKPGFGATVTASEPPARTADASTPSSWTTTSPQALPSSSSGNRISQWWGSIRGTSNEAELKPSSEANEKPPAAPPAAPTAWTTQTQAASTDAAPAASGAAGGPGTRVAVATPTAPVPSASRGDYRLQLSPTRSEDEARQLWQKVLSQNQQLSSIEPRIEKTDMGNLGTFYRLQIGPFPDKAESLKLCNALKRSGIDCFLVNP
ncbi:MAG: SPOR domain-containing protein [Methyloceanibacter sp.]|jgi:tetratricopeptide (TPR) repeat protein